jgi:hypothetical protein
MLRRDREQVPVRLRPGHSERAAGQERVCQGSWPALTQVLRDRSRVGRRGTDDECTTECTIITTTTTTTTGSLTVAV